MNNYVLSSKAFRELQTALYPRRSPYVQNGAQPPSLESLGGAGTQRGTPQATHAGDGIEKQIYNLDNGSTQDDVLNKTGVSALTTASYWLFRLDGEWQSFPAELDTCNPSNPQVVT